MGLERDFDGAEPIRHEPIERLAGPEERRRSESAWQLATGTFACPACDAPVLPSAGGVAPADVVACAFCSHTAAVRDFLSLGEPTRPARVAVRVRMQVLAGSAGGHMRNV